MMKKLCLIVLALSMLHEPAAADSACPSLVITGHPSYPPVAWGSDGEIVGAAPEMVANIARTLGVKKVTSRNFGSWEKAQAAAKSGEADIIFGIYKNDERRMWLDYVDPAFMMDPVSVVVRKGEGFAYAKWDDLKGRKGVTNTGESYGNKFDSFMASSLMVARTQGVEKAFEALMDKSADYLIIGLYPGKIKAKQLGVAAKLEFLPEEIDSFGMYVAFSKKSKCNDLMVRFTESIRKEVAEGRVKSLLDAAQKRAEQ
jgi:polar amino acid transport system substrate-binding protein